jgi:hypothetical protein
MAIEVNQAANADRAPSHAGSLVPQARRNARYGLIGICAAGAIAGAFLLTRE